MEDALIHQLRTATDKAMRDAILLEEAMAGAGTKDALLTQRIIRAHWDRNHIAQVKGETSGDYEKLLVALLGE